MPKRRNQNKRVKHHVHRAKRRKRSIIKPPSPSLSPPLSPIQTPSESSSSSSAIEIIDKLSKKKDHHEILYHKLYKERSQKEYNIRVNSMKGRDLSERIKNTKIKFSDILNPLSVQKSLQSILTKLNRGDVSNYSFSFTEGNKKNIAILDFDLGPKTGLRWNENQLIFTLLFEKSTIKDNLKISNNKKHQKTEHNITMNAAMDKAEFEVLAHLKTIDSVLYKTVANNQGVKHQLSIKKMYGQIQLADIKTKALELLGLSVKKHKIATPAPVSSSVLNINNNQNDNQNDNQNSDYSKLKKDLAAKEERIKKLEEKLMTQRNQSSMSPLELMLCMNMKNQQQQQQLQQPQHVIMPQYYNPNPYQYYQPNSYQYQKPTTPHSYAQYSPGVVTNSTPLTWECTICTFRNTPSKISCTICGCPKPQTHLNLPDL